MFDVPSATRADFYPADQPFSFVSAPLPNVAMASGPRFALSSVICFVTKPKACSQVTGISCPGLVSTQGRQDACWIGEQFSGCIALDAHLTAVHGKIVGSDFNNMVAPTWRLVLISESEVVIVIPHLGMHNKGNECASRFGRTVSALAIVIRPWALHFSFFKREHTHCELPHVKNETNGQAQIGTAGKMSTSSGSARNGRLQRSVQ